MSEYVSAALNQPVVLRNLKQRRRYSPFAPMITLWFVGLVSGWFAVAHSAHTFNLGMLATEPLKFVMLSAFFQRDFR